VLAGFGPVDNTGCLNLEAGNGTIQVYYSDEHALTLGVRRVVNNNVTTDYPITAMSGNNVSHAIHPATGDNILGKPGDPENFQAGTDTNTCAQTNCGRPMWPVLYVTDTADPDGPLAGDWQSDKTPPLGGGGLFNNPDDVFGTWKAAVKTVVGTTVTVTPDADPTGNTFASLASVGGDSPQPAGLTNLGYAAEIRFNLGTLHDRFGNPLVAGHAYRFEFMVHDGDQNKTGGDSGENCVTAVLPPGFVPTPTPNPTLTPALTPPPPTVTPTRTPTPLPQAKTSASVSCVPASVTVNTPTTCTVTVTNTTANHPNDGPHGTAAFTASTPAVAGSPCTLGNFTTTTSSCFVTWTPSTTGNKTIAATYSSFDLTKWKSPTNSPNFTVTVTP
jgi:hypothetical protein